MLMTLLLPMWVGLRTVSGENWDSPLVVDPGLLEPAERHTICAVRRLAHQRAVQQQPHNIPHERLFDALQLHSLCGDERPRRTTIGSAEHAKRPRSAVPDGAVHVDPVKGDDGAAGAGVFRTISAALAEARRGQGRTRPLALHSGIHYLNETIVLTAADSGFSMFAVPGATAWVSGGVPLTGLNWRRESNTGIFAATISDDVNIQGIPGLQTVDPYDFSPVSRFVRARYPNGDWERDMWGLCSTNECLNIGPAYTTPQRWGGDPEVSVNGAAAIPKSSVLSWWLPPAKPLPTQTFFNATHGGAACDGYTRNCTTYEYSIGHGGPCKLWASPDSNVNKAGSSYWCGKYCAGGGAGQDSQMSKAGWLGLPLGLTLNNTSAAYKRMQRWLDPVGAIVHVWMDSSWFTNMFEVTSANVKAGNLSFEDSGEFSGFPRGGWQGGRNWRGGKQLASDSSVAPLIIENVAEELDSENEFFYDQHTRVLRVKPNASMPWPPKILVASKLQTLIKLAGTRASPVRDVSFHGFGWRDAAYTYMERWGVPSGGDWSLYHGAAVHIHGAERSIIHDCDFVRLDNNAIILTGYTRNVSITNNSASWLGMNFAAAWGDTDEMDATAGNQPRGTVVSGNLVGELGIWESKYRCISVCLKP